MSIDLAIQNGRDCFAAILAYDAQAATDGWDPEALRQVISENYPVPMRYEWAYLVGQLRVNEGIPEDKNAGWRDLRPDLNTYAKRKLILWAMADFDEKKESIQFFEWYQKYLKVGQELLHVQKVCERYYDFIIYRLVDEPGFAISEVRNQSSAMWTVERRITKAQVIDTIQDPRWRGKLTWDQHASLGPADFGLEGVS